MIIFCLSSRFGARRTLSYVIMKKVEFIKYEAPEVEIIEVEVEKGFAASGNVEDPNYGGGV